MCGRIVQTCVIVLVALPWMACGKSQSSSTARAMAAAARPTAATLPARAESLPQEKEQQKQPPAAGKGIRGVNLEEFLKTHYVQVHPELKEDSSSDTDNLNTECGEDQEPIRSLAAMQFGDLDGDGQDEAVYQGFTCMSGTAGVDFYGVLKMMPDGQIIALPIEEERKEFKGRHNLYEGLRGHLGLQIKSGQLVEIYPVYNGDEANCCPEGGERHFVYRWDGKQFVLDDVVDTPPKKSEN